LPSIPRGHRVVRKHKENIVEPTRYEAASCRIIKSCVCWMLTLSVYANFVCVAVLLLLLPTPSAERWSGPHLLGMMCRSCDYCRGGYLAGASRALGLCDPTTGNEYRGCKTTGTETRQ
jgi:hypothetical protein